MGIAYDMKSRTFKLDTPASTYVIGIVDDENFIGHVYYGKRVPDEDLTYLLRTQEPPFTPSVNDRERVAFLDSFPMEYPTHGLGDFREDCLSVRTGAGHSACGLRYRSHRIYAGKPRLEGLPATFGGEKDCTTLELLAEDPILRLQVTLLYTAFEKLDVITRSVKVKNASRESVGLTKVFSACLDMDNRGFDLITLHGAWARERQIQRQPVGYGKQSVSSVRGESSHQDHPFLALAEMTATQDRGEVYGMHFVYSGNFLAQAELSQFDTVRAVMGIHPSDFCWLLEPGETFTAPEAVLVYSDEGIGGMTRTFHDLYRGHLIRGEYRDRPRPVLINNWEATYFDFNTEKLLSIAREASRLGIEMLVMDDGWFGSRSSDNCALGDWKVNEQKLPGGLRYLVDEVNQLGMQFGIWFEPEMISPDSDLYRAHPDWAIQIPGRTPSLSRCQYVLDFSRREVREYVYESVRAVLKSANITYVKWDMNRQLSDLGSSALPAGRQGELFHRYVLGVYELQERLITEFPHLLLENCSGGGARFDPGMLYYSPQIWCSDDTDAVERLSIQEGTAMLYPLSTIGAHVSDCPNHTVGRSTPFETRGYVALAGTFGYELDVTRIPQEDRDRIPAQVAMYHQYNGLIRRGDYSRIASFAENHVFDCWQVTSKDKTEALVTFIQVLGRPNVHSMRIRLKGLDENTRYRVEGTEQVLSGAALMRAGVNVAGLTGDFQGKLIHLTADGPSAY
jgi:Alpha-galactosidase